MFSSEAEWIASALKELAGEDLYPLLNLGSSTAEFRQKTQPWIEEVVFRPLRERGLPVIHSDLKPAVGVDLVGDIYDAEFRSQVRDMEFRTILCSNILEHVTSPVEFGRLVTELLPHGGYVIATAPRRYPYHPDPIDNGFRPDPRQLQQLFPGSHLVREEVLSSSFWERFRGHPEKLATFVVRLLVPFWRFEGWKVATGYLPYLRRELQVSCVVLKCSGD